MRTRTEPLESFAHKTFTLDSGRNVKYYPLSKDECFLPVKMLSKALETNLQSLENLQKVKTSSDVDSMDMAAIQSAILSKYVIFALTLEDPDFEFDVELPNNTLLLTPKEWLEFASKVSAECRSRKGRSIYTETDIEKLGALAQGILAEEVEQEKKA